MCVIIADCAVKITVVLTFAKAFRVGIGSPISPPFCKTLKRPCFSEPKKWHKLCTTSFQFSKHYKRRHTENMEAKQLNIT